MRILMLSATFPYPPTKGGTPIRTFNLLDYLRQRHEVTVATLRSPDVTEEEIAALRDYVTDLVIYDRPPEATASLPKKVKRLGKFLITGTPPSVRSSYSADLQAWVDRAIADGKFDVVTCEHSVNEIYVRPEFRQRVRTVVDVHSSIYATFRKQLETGTAEKPWRDRLNLPLLQRYERRYSQKFTEIVVTTEDDRTQFQTFAPQTPIAVIPNGVDLTGFPYRTQDPGGQHLVFAGAMDYIANVDTARYLVQEILPPLRDRYPKVKVSIVGAKPTPDVQALGQIPGVTITGKVPSMVDYLHQATICVVPMRTGYGIKNKTLEAMAAGLPVVGSDRGLEGLAVDGPNHPLRALRANTIPEYVAAIGNLLDNISLRTAIAQAARSYVEQEFTWEQAGRRYESVLLGEFRG